MSPSYPRNARAIGRESECEQFDSRARCSTAKVSQVQLPQQPMSRRAAR